MLTAGEQEWVGGRGEGGGESNNIPVHVRTCIHTGHEATIGTSGECEGEYNKTSC